MVLGYYFNNSGLILEVLSLCVTFRFALPAFSPVTCDSLVN